MVAYRGRGFNGLGSLGDDLSPSGDTYVNPIGTNAYGDTIVESPASTGYTTSPDAYAALQNSLQNLQLTSSSNPLNVLTANPVYLILGVIAIAAIFGRK